MERTPTLTDPIKRWLAFALLMLALNFGWEMMQAKWFASMQRLPLWRGTLLCFRAALGKLQPRARDQVGDHSRNEHIAAPCSRADPLGGMNCHPRDTAVVQLDLGPSHGSLRCTPAMAAGIVDELMGHGRLARRRDGSQETETETLALGEAAETDPKPSCLLVWAIVVSTNIASSCN